MFSPTCFSMLIMCCFLAGDEMEPDVEEDEYDEDVVSNLVMTNHSLHGLGRLYFSQKANLCSCLPVGCLGSRVTRLKNLAYNAGILVFGTKSVGHQRSNEKEKQQSQTKGSPRVTDSGCRYFINTN